MHLHADDLCLTDQTNSTISSLLGRGKLDSVSIIVTTKSFNTYSKSLAGIKVPVFLHFSLTEGTPLSDINVISSIVNEQGKFFSQPKLILKCIIRTINKSEIRHELVAQMSALRSKGVDIVGIDTHQHIHAFNPVSSVVHEYAKKQNIKFVRSYSEVKTIHASTWAVRGAYMLLARCTSFKSLPVSWREKRWRPFVMSTWEKVESAPNNVIVVVHPGTDFDCQQSLPRQLLSHIINTQKNR